MSPELVTTAVSPEIALTLGRLLNCGKIQETWFIFLAMFGGHHGETATVTPAY